MRRIAFHVAGRVQGVGFRAATEREARRHGVTGFVRNRVDGTVEGEAQGAGDAITAFAAWLRQGPALARVAHVDLRELPTSAAERAFEVRCGPARA
jgi:acylphosphatase